MEDQSRVAAVACIAERRAGAAGRNGGKRSAALRWSALTRPVARASSATVERAATLHGLPAAPYEFPIARAPTASHVPRL